MTARPLKAQDVARLEGLDLSSAAEAATVAAGNYVMTKCAGPEPMARAASDPSVTEYFVYGWLKSIAGYLGTVQKGLDSVYLLPTAEHGDPNVHDVVVLADAGNAALDLLSSSIEDQFDRVRDEMCLPCVVKVRTMSREDMVRGYSLLGGMHNPAMQIWP